MTKSQYLSMALGAALVSAANILASHVLTPRPPWAFARMLGGYTVYPSLSATPQGLPGQVEAMMALPTYLGLLTGAILAAGIAAVLWAYALFKAPPEPAGPPPASRAKWLPLLLLMPCAIHVGGMARFCWQLRQQPGSYSQGLLESNVYIAADSLQKATQLPADSLTGR